jgi:hypothetical protein
MNPQQLLPYMGATISLCGIIFQVGKQSEKVDMFVGKVEAQEKKVDYNDKMLCEIKSDLKTVSHDVAAIKDDFHDIKHILNKI